MAADLTDPVAPSERPGCLARLGALGATLLVVAVLFLACVLALSLL